MPQRTQEADDRYFQMYGLTAQAPQTLNMALQQAIASLRRTLYAPSVSELTAPELAVLRQAGVDVDDHPDRDDPLATYVTAFGAILATCLTPAQAAARLGGITQVRVRQMIREGALYAVRIENRWKIPLFQFDRDGLVPNVGLVNAAVPRTLDPVSVLRWYTTPDPQIETTDGARSARSSGSRPACRRSPSSRSRATCDPHMPKIPRTPPSDALAALSPDALRRPPRPRPSAIPPGRRAS